MDDPVVLVYVGNRDGNERFVLNLPKSDITQSQLNEIARLRCLSPEDTRDALLAYNGIWELPEPGPVNAAIEVEDTLTPFREEPMQAFGEAASDKRRRRES